MEVGVDWSGLPQEIIELISKSITIYGDYLRFRCVCRRWNSYVPKTLLHLPPQPPWLMLSHNSFFDISNNKIHRFNLPRCSEPTLISVICGSSHGWLVILKQTSELTLLNPITRATLSLPSLHNYPHLVAKLCDHNNNNLHLIKVVLSSSPSLSDDDDDFIAFAILNRSNFVFCKKGYDSWVHLNHVNENYHRWIDAIYKNGSFYVTNTAGTIAVCDVEDPRFLFVEIPDNTSLGRFSDIGYMVFAGEDMLLVKRHWIYSEELKMFTVKYFIFKMNRNAHKWEEIQTLGENSVFIGNNSSHYFPAADFVGCRPNCIYFAVDGLDGNSEFGIYSISDKSIDPLPCDSYISNSGFGYPFWFMPNPR